MTQKRRLVFVSPRFLFPADSGGKIRTTQILRGLKDGAFHISLVMPASANLRGRYASEIETICDELISWDERQKNRWFASIASAIGIFSRYPIPVKSDYDVVGARVIRDTLETKPDVVVFDFPHSAILAPQSIGVPSVMFTHNIESEIFERHWKVASSVIMKFVWGNQYRKMCRFEKHTLAKFDTTVAVSDRDCEFFAREWGIAQCRSIPTGVDTDFFDYRSPVNDGQVVFCGSMDWMANIDGVEFFHNHVWPLVRQRCPEARMKVVGRTPPEAMVKRICSASPEWEFTGFVDDIRDHIGGAAAFVIPLRVGGGTRIKAFEAMAIGAPVVSTAIGIEGLSVSDGVHYLEADEPAAMADKVSLLLNDKSVRESVSIAARKLVEENFGFRRAAKVFEDICVETAASAVAR